MGVAEAVQLADGDRVIPGLARRAEQVGGDDLLTDPVRVQAVHLHDPVVADLVLRVVVVRTDDTG